MRKLPLAIAVLLLLTVPAFAHAQGNSAIDQYTEGVPDADGDSLDASGAGGSGDGDSGGSAPPAAPTETGSEGEIGGEDEVPSEPAQSGPAGQNGKDNGGGGGSDATPASGEATPTTATDEVATTPAADSDSGGIGALPIILAITLLAAVGYAVYEWMRRRPSRTISNPSA